MSTKTTFKRVALVAVAALGLGVLSVAPSSAVVQADTMTLSSATGSTTVGTAVTVNVTTAFLQETSSDTMTVSLSYDAAPAGITASEVAFSSIITATGDLGSPTVDTGTVVGTSRQAHISAATAASINKTLTVKLTPTKAGTYVIKFTPAIAGVTTAPVSTAKTWTVTVAAKTLGWTSTFIGAYTNGTSDTATADATISTTGAASSTPKARIDVGQGYGATSGSDTSTAADAAAVVVATDKGLVSKTNDLSAAAKSVTDAAATDPDADYYVFSNGDIGAASITITVGGVLKATKTVTFTGPATTMTATLATNTFTGVLGTSTWTIAAKDAGGTTASLPSGLTVKSSDTSVATVAIASSTVTVTGVKAGTSTITVTDPATTGTVPAVSFTATVAPVRPTSVDITFDNASYNVGDLITMTVAANMGDSATAQLFSSTGVVLSSSVVASGTALPTGASTYAIVGGKATFKFYAPAVSGNLVVTATSGGAVDVTTAIVLSKTIAIVNPGIDAATDAAIEAFDAANAATDAALSAAEAADLATQAAQEASDAVAALSETVTQLIAGLQAQIKTLAAALAKIAALQQKIAKKVKA